MKALIEKKEELVNHMEITNKYLGSYRCEVKRKEKEAMVNLVLECEQEQAGAEGEEEAGKASKYCVEHYRILPNTIEHNLFTIMTFFHFSFTE